MRWCEEIEKFGEVFIGNNVNIGYNYNICSQKKCRSKVEKLTKVQKTCVLEL